MFLYRTSMKHPWWAITLAFWLTFAAGLGLRSLHLRTDGFALVPESDPRIAADATVREVFSYADPFVVLIQSNREQGVFHPKTLQLVRELTTRLQQIKGLLPQNLTSLATESHFLRRNRGLKYQTLLETERTSFDALQQLRVDIEAIGLYTGTLISDDGRDTAIYVDAVPHLDRISLYRTICETVARSNTGPETVQVLGAPAAETLLGRHIMEDLGVPARFLGSQTSTPPGLVGLVPLVILVLILVFFAVFRSWVAAFLPLMEAGAALVFCFGLMGWLGVPIYLTTAVLPIILVAMGITDEIHIFYRYLSLLGENNSQDTAVTVSRVMAEMWRPIIKTSLTTSIGFLSFALSPIVPVRIFGIFTAIGVLFCMLWSLWAIPALLCLIPSRWFRPVEKTVLSTFPLLLVRPGRHPWRVLLVTLLLALSALPGLFKLTVQDSWTDGFARDSSFRRATAHFDAHFHGAHVLLLSLDAGQPVLTRQTKAALMGGHLHLLPGDLLQDPQQLVGRQIQFVLQEPSDLPGPASRATRPRQWKAYIDSARREGEHIAVTTPKRSGSPKFWLRPKPEAMAQVTITATPFANPAILSRVKQFEQRLLQQADVGGVLGPNNYLETTGFMLHPEQADARVLPQNTREVLSLWSKFRFIRGEERLRQVVDASFRKGLMAVFVRDANFRKVADLMTVLDGLEAELLAPMAINLTLAGDLAVSQTLIEGIVTTQYRSLCFSLLGVFLVAALLNRSLGRGLLVLLPSAIAVGLSFAAMGVLAVPIGVATSMFAGMTLGLGVDFAVHLLDREALLRKQGLSAKDALDGAVAQTAPANFINAFALAAGFGLLYLSQVPANARLGLLVVCGVLTCALVSVFLVPALLRLVRK